MWGTTGATASPQVKDEGGGGVFSNMLLDSFQEHFTDRTLSRRDDDAGSL